MAEKGLSGFFKALTFQSSVPNIAFAWFGLVVFGSVLWFVGHMFMPEAIPQFPLLAIGGVTGAGVATQVQTMGSACPSDLLVPIYQKASYDDPTTGNTDTLVATNVYIYDMSAPSTPAIIGSTGTSGYITNGSISCGKQFNAFIGDGGATYYYAKLQGNAQGGRVDLSAKLKRTSTATATFSNTTTLGASSVGVSIGTGETNSDATIRVKAGSYYYGDGAFEICAQYNSANISKVSFGAQATPKAPDPSISSVSGTRLECYEVAKELYNNNYIELPVVIQAVSGVNPANTNITIYLNDKACFLKNGDCTPSYTNMDTNADIGLPIVTLNNAIQVN